MDSAKSVAQISKKVASDKAKSFVQAKPSEAQFIDRNSRREPCTKIPAPVQRSVDETETPSQEEEGRYQETYGRSGGVKPHVMEIVVKESGDLATSGDTAAEISSAEAANKPSDIGETEANVNEVIKEFLSSITEEEVTEVTPSSKIPRSPDQDLAMVVSAGPVHTPIVDLLVTEPVVTPVGKETVHEKEPDVETMLESTNVADDEVMQTEKVTEHSGVEKILKQ